MPILAEGKEGSSRRRLWPLASVFAAVVLVTAGSAVGARAASSHGITLGRTTYYLRVYPKPPVTQMGGCGTGRVYDAQVGPWIVSITSGG